MRRKNIFQGLILVLVITSVVAQSEEENEEEQEQNSPEEMRERLVYSSARTSPDITSSPPPTSDRSKALANKLRDTILARSEEIEHLRGFTRDTRSLLQDEADPPVPADQGLQSGAGCRGEDPATTAQARELHEAIKAVKETLTQIPTMIKQELLRISCQNEPDSQACRSNDLSIVCNMTKSFAEMANVTSRILTIQGFTLLLSKSEATWLEARDTCKKLGMTLVEIEGWEKQHLLERVMNEAYPGADVWTGLNSDGQPRPLDLKFVGSGKKLFDYSDYTNWSPGEPNACTGGVCRCMRLTSERRAWFLNDCTNEYYFICQCAGSSDAHEKK